MPGASPTMTLPIPRLAERHQGDTNLSYPPKGIVRFYNGRGTVGASRRTARAPCWTRLPQFGPTTCDDGLHAKAGVVGHEPRAGPTVRAAGVSGRGTSPGYAQPGWHLATFWYEARMEDPEGAWDAEFPLFTGGGGADAVDFGSSPTSMVARRIWAVPILQLFTI